VAVAVQLHFHGATLEQYDEMIERFGSLRGGPAPQHELFHWVTKTDDGFRITDVWASRAAFEEFEADTLRPLYKEVGIVHLPEIRFFDVHNYLAGGRWRG
jgi:hypothetical protein